MFLQGNQMQLSKKTKLFYQFFIAFQESASIFQHFQNKISVIAQVFPKLLTPKNLVT